MYELLVVIVIIIVLVFILRDKGENAVGDKKIASAYRPQLDKLRQWYLYNPAFNGRRVADPSYARLFKEWKLAGQPDVDNIPYEWIWKPRG